MLPKIPNRRKTYYKITNQKENHHGLQYHDNIIIDPNIFNVYLKNSYIRGGIYFTTKEHLHEFFGYGCWIRPVKIPSDAKVVLDLTGNKYRADKLFFKPRKNFDFYIDKLFDKKTFPEKDYWYLAKYCSKYFNKWFDKKTFLKENYWSLAKYCLKYKHIWDYLYLNRYCLEYKHIWG